MREILPHPEFKLLQDLILRKALKTDFAFSFVQKVVIGHIRGKLNGMKAGVAGRNVIRPDGSFDDTSGNLASHDRAEIRNDFLNTNT